MPNFTNGTVTSVTLDEYDTLFVSGTARLQVTVGSKPQFETTSVGSLTFGPFGFITYVTINAMSSGSYLQQPSNYPTPVTMVDVSPAQLAAPTPAQLAATNVLYQRNGAPYDIYQSNGTALIALGSFSGIDGVARTAASAAQTTANGKIAATDLKTINGGSLVGFGDIVTIAAQVGALAASTTVPPNATAVINAVAVKLAATDLKTINSASIVGTGDIAIAIVQVGALAASATASPNATAVQNAIAASGGATISVASGIVIPLDTAGNGKQMVEQTLSINSAFTYSGAIEGGNCNFSLIGNGTNSPILSAFTLANGYVYNSLGGSRNIYSAVYNYGTPLLYGVAGAATVVVPGAATLSAGATTTTTQALTITAPVTGSAVTSYATFYKRAVDPSYTAGPTGASLSVSITGLVASTSYNYKTVASNSAGSGSDSNIVTVTTATPAGALSVATTPYTPINVTTSGFLDWAQLVDPASIAGNTYFHKGAVNLIGGFTAVNATVTGNGQNIPYSWTAGDSVYTGGGVTSQPSSTGIVATTTTALSKYTVTFPAGTVSRKARVYLKTFRDIVSNTTGKTTLRATLSDGSAAQSVTVISPTADGLTNVAYEWTFTAASTGQTLTVDIEIAANDKGQLLLDVATFST